MNNTSQILYLLDGAFESLQNRGDHVRAKVYETRKEINTKLKEI